MAHSLSYLSRSHFSSRRLLTPLTPASSLGGVGVTIVTTEEEQKAQWVPLGLVSVIRVTGAGTLLGAIDGEKHKN